MLLSAGARGAPFLQHLLPALQPCDANAFNKDLFPLIHALGMAHATGRSRAAPMTLSLSLAVLLTDISTRVKIELISDNEVKARNIDVETYNRVVELSGFVESKDEAPRAITLARNLDGVKSVKDGMHVRQ
jgi:osmotically-inducible protein OsmY